MILKGAGSLQVVLPNSQYNRASFVHSVFAEALECFFLRRFLVNINPKIPKKLEDLSTSLDYQQDVCKD